MSVRKRIDRIVRQAGLRDPEEGGARRHAVPLMNGFRRFWNKTCKEALSNYSLLASLIRKEFMMGHKGFVSLDQNYFKTSVLELAGECAGVVPDLTIDDSERLRRSSRRMSANMRELEAKDARTDQLERKVRNLEGLRVEALDMDKLLEEANMDMRAATEGDLSALGALMRRLEACHRANLAEATAARDSKIADLEGTLADLARGEKPGDGPPPGDGEPDGDGTHSHHGAD